MAKKAITAEAYSEDWRDEWSSNSRSLSVCL